MSKSFFLLLAFIILFALVSCQREDTTKTFYTRQIVDSKDAPKAIGPYSQAVLIGNTVYLSGQIALDEKTGNLVNSDIKEETIQVMKNIGAVLRDVKFDYDNIVQAIIYLKDLENYSAVNEVYASFFKRSYPARVCVQVARLPKDANIEIAVVAMK